MSFFCITWHYYCNKYLSLTESLQQQNQILFEDRPKSETHEVKISIMIVFHSFPNPIFVTTWEMKIIYANNAFLDLWGFRSLKQAQGLSANSLWNNKSYAQEAIKNAKTYGRWYGSLEAYTNKDEERYLDVSVEILNRKHHRGQYLIVLCIDATELHLIKKRAESIEQISSHFVFEVNNEYKISYISSGVNKQTGYKPEELIDKPLHEVLRQQDIYAFYSLAHKLRNNPDSMEEIILNFQTKQNVLKSILTNLVPIVHYDGAIKGFRGICYEADRKKRLKKIIEQKNEKVKQKNEQLNELNSALKVLIEKQQEYIEEVKADLTEKLVHCVLPHIDTIENSIDDPNLIETTQMIRESISSFSMSSNKSLLQLFNPKELKIIDYILHGKSSKEIASMLNLSTRTIQFHRERIREKLNLKHSSENLREKLAEMFYGNNTEDFN